MEKSQQRSKKGDGAKRRRGLGRTLAAAEEVEVKANVNFVRLRYEGNAKDNQDDPSRVALSRAHKAAQLQLSEDRLAVTGYKGFRTARSSHGAHQGAFYCEVVVTRMGSTGHCRLGFCTRKAELQAPVGYDTFGLSYRDVDGSKVTNGLREPYGQPFREGDVVGMYIYLPRGGRTLEPQQNEYTKYKGKWMRIEDPEPKPEVLQGSVIAFSVNGVSQGVAYRDFNEGTYYPAVSLYTMPEQVEGATVTLNFGPSFRHAPQQPEGCPAPAAMCELAPGPRADPPGGVAALPGPATAGTSAAVPAREVQRADAAGNVEMRESDGLAAAAVPVDMGVKVEGA